MPVFSCPKCGARIRANDQAAFQRSTCPKCKNPFGAALPKDAQIMPHSSPPRVATDALDFSAQEEEQPVNPEESSATSERWWGRSLDRRTRDAQPTPERKENLLWLWSLTFCGLACVTVLLVPRLLAFFPVAFAFVGFTCGLGTMATARRGSVFFFGFVLMFGGMILTILLFVVAIGAQLPQLQEQGLRQILER